MAVTHASRVLPLLLVVTAIPCIGAAAPAVPVVYQDEHVLVRAGLVESGNQAIHLGDSISLVVDIEFDAGTVRVETPDDEWFQRAFAGVAGIRVYDTVAIAEESTRGDRVRIASHWRLQVLDCPADVLSCPGSKSYDLPIMTVSYQLAGGDGDRVDGRAARFRPWPGRLDVASAIAIQPRQGSRLTDILPGGAQPQIMADPGPSGAGGWLIAAGAVLLLGSLLPAAQQGQPGRSARREQSVDTRWRRALAAAADTALSPEQRADVMRRAVAWYCLDELGINPFSWLGPGGADRIPEDPTLVAWHALFLDLLAEQGLEPAGAASFAARIESLGAFGADAPAVAA